ncbi:hypothetical protein MTP04_13640 [Lysinibacillus sp. PLM2]|nr:hypothetical protein MTP04_13640 [Lysinibacillus sp. PLM2]
MIKDITSFLTFDSKVNECRNERIITCKGEVYILELQSNYKFKKRKSIEICAKNNQLIIFIIVTISRIVII